MNVEVSVVLPDNVKIPIKVILVDWEGVHVTGLQFVF